MEVSSNPSPGDHEEVEEAGEAMLWSLQEAVERQTLQIGASACGATAVVDVLKALGIEVAPGEVDRCVQTRLRRNESPLPDYLLSRSEAGATHAQLISGAEEASKGKVVGRFFHLHPRRRVSVVCWLAHWIRKGAVPVATMNMQKAVPEGEEIPDAWHHQLIFGVMMNAVFMTNPLDVVNGEIYSWNRGSAVTVGLWPNKGTFNWLQSVPQIFFLTAYGVVAAIFVKVTETEVHERLCSDSVLLIRREDVLQRLTPDCSLSSLTENQCDPCWQSLDVEGQVRQMEAEQGQELTTHITIPAAYKSGITLFARRHSPLGQEILDSPELPLV